jgi:two-component sensor histidine kinase
MVRADQLLTSVIDATIHAGTSADQPVDVSRTYDPVLLYPDQAVPFLLLATEAVTNALKYMGRRADGVAKLDLRLEALKDGQAKFSVVNTQGKPLYPVDQVKGSGLGRALLAGFSTQVGGRIEQAETDTQYSFQLTFTPASFDPVVRDIVMADLDHDPEASGL